MLLKAVSLPGRIVGGVVPESQSGRLDTPTAAKETITKNLLPGGVQMAGEWDEAMALGCCQIYALRGDTLVTFDFRGWRDDMKGAASILDKALVRIEKPLSIDGRAGNDAAQQREAQRPAKRDACSLLTRRRSPSDSRTAARRSGSEEQGQFGLRYRFTQAESENSTLKDAPEAFKSILGGLTGGKTGLVSGAVDTAITITWRGGFRTMHDGQMVAGGVGWRICRTARHAGARGRQAGRTMDRGFPDVADLHRREEGCRRIDRHRAHAVEQAGRDPPQARDGDHRKDLNHMRQTVLSAIVVLPFVAACGGSSPASGPAPVSSTAASAPGVQDLTGRPGNVFRVTWKPATVVIDRATALGALRSVSSDESVLVFDGSVAALNALEPGRILLLERIALRKVSAVRRAGDQLVVQVEPASLTEAIQDGEIRWNIPIRFGTMLSAGDQPDRFRLMPALYAAGPIEKSGEKNGWKYKFTAAPGPGRANLGLTLTKDVNGIETALDATGYIPDFDSIAAIVIGGGAVSQMDFETKNLSGEVEMNISAKTKDKPGGFGKKQVKLPAILKAPFFLGMLPLTLEISSAITFTPGLGANNQLATAKFQA